MIEIELMDDDNEPREFHALLIHVSVDIFQPNWA